MRIPEGDWHCPSCVSGLGKIQLANQKIYATRRHLKKSFGGETQASRQVVNQLANIMEEKEYWEFSTEEVHIFNFDCSDQWNIFLCCLFIHKLVFVAMEKYLQNFFFWVNSSGSLLVLIDSQIGSSFSSFCNFELNLL